MGGQIRLLFATRYSLPFYQSLIASRRSLFAIRHSLFAAISARQEPRPPTSFRLPSLVPRSLPFLSHVPFSIPTLNSELATHFHAIHSRKY